ncbi:MAG: hypothetical protein ABJA98_26440 [Acidobacteriota bacterium]
MNRLAALVVAVFASSLPAHAQQLQTASKARSVREVAVAAPDPASLVGLTKAQVQARLGKASTAFPRIWNYKQSKGTLHVRFGPDGVVLDAEIDVEPRSSGRG